MKKYKRDKLKKQSSSGITLIALVITIIVLIILAGVAISFIIGDNGVVNQAQEAKDKTEEASLKEEVELALQDKLIEELSKTGNTSLKDILERNINSGAQVETGPTLKDGKEAYYVTKDDETITVYPDGTMEIGRVDFWDGTSSNQPSYDSTTNSVTITTGADLNYLAQYINGTLTATVDEVASVAENGSFTINENTTIYLNTSIDFQGYSWTPIGLGAKSDGSDSFKGIFEGNNNFVKNVKIDTTANFAGFFGRSMDANPSIIRNFTIKDSEIIGTNCMGGIIGRGTTLENCHNVNTTVKSREGSYSGIGGLAGQINNIENCSNSGEVTGNNYCGGIAGYVKTKCIGCTNTGTVIGTLNHVGGIVGSLDTPSQSSNCHNSGAVIGNSNYVGGIAGILNANTSVSNSSNTATVTGKGLDTGGIVGIMHQSTSSEEKLNTIEKCYNSGKVNGNIIVGGIVGLIEGTKSYATVQQCYNKGSVTGIQAIGSILGTEDGVGLNTLNNLYYLRSLELKAIGGGSEPADDEENFVMPVDDNINSYRDFVIWINNK